MPPFRAVKVREVGDLHKGDQLAADRRVYEHHMIVTEDPDDLTEVSVIQLTNDMKHGAKGVILGSGRLGFPIAKVRADVIDISSDVRNGKIYRIDYDQCFFSPDETVQRAKSKLGKKKYSLWRYNCEHFATWCKTGSRESSQVKSASKAVSEGTKSVAGEGVKQVAREGTTTAMKEVKKTSLSEGSKSAAEEGVKQVAREGAKAAMTKAGNEALKETLIIMSNPITAGQAIRETTKKVIEDATVSLKDPVVNFAMERATNVAIAKLEKELLKETLTKISTGQAINEATKSIVEASTARLKDPVLNLILEGAARDVAKDTVKENAKQLAQEGTKAVIKDTAKTALNEGTKSVVEEGAKQVAREGGKTAMKETAKTAVKEGAKSAAGEGAKQAAKSGGKSLVKKIVDSQGALGIGLTAAVEVYDFYSHTRESKKKLDNGEISQGEFEKQIATHAVKGVASGTATLVGSAVGQTLIPIPVLGGMVGGMAGKAAVCLGGLALGQLTG